MDSRYIEVFVFRGYALDEFRQRLDVAATESSALNSEGVVGNELINRLWKQSQLLTIPVKFGLLIRLAIISRDLLLRLLEEFLILSHI